MRINCVMLSIYSFVFYLITICKNKEINYNYLVHLLIILTKLRLAVTINKKGFMKIILNYQEQTSYRIDVYK